MAAAMRGLRGLHVLLLAVEAGGARAAAPPAPPWDGRSGCYVLRPPPALATPPRAIVHFCGGVFAAAIPHALYRHFLSELAHRGFVVVASPYDVDFDFGTCTAQVRATYADALPAVRADHGELPQLAVGHSLGAVVLTMCATAAAAAAPPYVGAVHIAYNHRPLRELVPGYDALIAPAIGAQYGALRGALAWLGTGGAADGAPPSPPPPPVPPPPALRPRRHALVRALADALALARGLGRQLPTLLGELADGVRELQPPPEAVLTAARERYSIPHSLLVSFAPDPLDGSDALEDALSARARRCPHVGLRRIRLRGSHTTPLDAEPMVVRALQTAARVAPQPVRPLLSRLAAAARRAALANVDALVDAIDEWAAERCALRRPSSHCECDEQGLSSSSLAADAFDFQG